MTSFFLLKLPKDLNNFLEYQELYERHYLKIITWLSLPLIATLFFYNIYSSRYIETGFTSILFLILCIFLKVLNSNDSKQTISKEIVCISRVVMVLFILFLIYTIGVTHSISKTPLAMVLPIFLFFSTRPKEKLFWILIVGILLIYFILSAKLNPSAAELFEFKTKILIAYSILTMVALLASAIVQSVIKNLFNNQNELQKKNQALKQEIADRAIADIALVKSERKYRELVESIDEVIYSMDSKGIITYISPPIALIMGYKPAEIIGTPFVQYIHEDDLERIISALEKLKDGKIKPSEYRVKTKSGEYRWIRSLSRAAKKLGGDDDIQGLIIDIDEQKQIYESLKKNEKQLQTIFENAGDGILVITNSDKKIVQSNKKMQDLLGYSQNEIKELSIFDINSQKKFADAIEQYVKMGKQEVILSTSVPIEKKDGTVFYADISSSLIELENKECLMGIFRDVSKLKQIEDEKLRLENQLLQSQKMQAIGTLAGGIAHDFNNILSPIISHAEILLLDLDKDNQSRESIQEIYGSSMRAKELVHQILTFSRQDEREDKLLKIQPILEETLKMIRSTTPSTVVIHSDSDTDSGVIKADSTQIHQLIMNSLTNAYHSLENSTGEIWIKLSTIKLNLSQLPKPGMISGDYKLLSIKDTGIGMDKSTRQRIFEPFFTTKKHGKGTGLGLAVVHGIIENLNGAIKIISEPGKGTELQFYFPVIQKAYNDVEIGKKPIEKGFGKILFIDDEEAVCDVTPKLLSKLGYQVEPYQNPNEALTVFQSDPNNFDLVITDMTMPQMTGDKLAEKILSTRPDIPIIICTGHSTQLDEQKAKEMGIADFALKPVTMSKFAEIIHKALA